jgi:TolB-like protein/class 3 adenylate cyclase/Tfp pilus assembly protein PilF
VERKLVAILSADVVGYSRLMADDDAETVETLKAHKERIGGLIRQHGGRVVDAVGDDLLADFPSVVDAVACGVAVQNELAMRNREVAAGRKMLFRIGINLGDVIVDEERIYGDGVNVSARIQALADEGGVSISGSAFDQVDGKLGLEFEDLGPRQVKNIPRPVRVYRVRVTPAHEEVASQTVPGFSGRPAIAVLPFDNLSGDPEQEYFADGLVEDLISRLSTWRRFPVIARNSSFVYKRSAVDVRQVSRELGVRYVVEGSVRKAGDRVRINAQLIDATTGHHIWAERFDRKLQDVFALQDEITEAIATSMNPDLSRSDDERIARQDPQSLDAWDCAQRGWWHVGRFTSADNAKALDLFDRATQMDARLASAWAGIAHTRYFEIAYQWTESPHESRDAVMQAAERSVELAGFQAGSHLALAYACSLTGARERMIAAFEQAIQLNPSVHQAYTRLGLFLALAGQPEEAISRLMQGMRLNPKDPNVWATLSYMAIAHFAAGRYQDAVEWVRRALEGRPDFPVACSVHAASLAHLDRVPEAREAFTELMRIQPGFSASTVDLLLSSADADVAERFIGGLRKAGLS